MTLQVHEGRKNCPGSLASHCSLLPYLDSEMTYLLAGAMEIGEKHYLGTLYCPSLPELAALRHKPELARYVSVIWTLLGASRKH